jgi:hypothetical protein
MGMERRGEEKGGEGGRVKEILPQIIQHISPEIGDQWKN